MAQAPHRPRSAPQEPLAQARAHLEASRVDAALQSCRAALEAAPDHVPALHLLGVILTRAGRAAEALAPLQRAAAAAPASAAVRLALGNAQRKSGDLRAALASFALAASAEPSSTAAAFNLGITAAELGERERAIEALATVARLDPMDFEAAQLLVDHVAAAVREAAGVSVEAPPPRARAAAASISVGFCSVDAARAAAAERSLSAALGAAAREFIVIRDARSLAEGFNRVVEAATGDMLVLCHDDIEILGGPIDGALAGALESVDMVGVAGSDRVTGPAVLWPGHPHVHGWVSYPREDAIEAAPLGFRNGLVTGVQALDGVFIAMRRAALGALRFDAGRFDGFHFYDLDFTYRAHLAGLRLGVTTDVSLLHASEGRFDEDWKRYAGRFQEKFPQLRGAQGSPHWYAARFGTRGEVLAFYARLRALFA